MAPDALPRNHRHVKIEKKASPAPRAHALAGEMCGLDDGMVDVGTSKRASSGGVSVQIESS